MLEESRGSKYSMVFESYKKAERKRERKRTIEGGEGRERKRKQGRKCANGKCLETHIQS
jgi:hypothetical protein